jgi:hypothetical protein
VHGDLDLVDEVLHVQRLDAAFQVGLHPVFVTRVGVHHVPVAGQHAEFPLELLPHAVGRIVRRAVGGFVPRVVGRGSNILSFVSRDSYVFSRHFFSRHFFSRHFLSRGAHFSIALGV